MCDVLMSPFGAHHYVVMASQPEQAPVETLFHVRTRSSNPASVGGTGVKSHGADAVCNIPVIQKTPCGFCLRFARAIIHDGNAEKFTFGISMGTTGQHYFSFLFRAGAIIFKQFSIIVKYDMHGSFRLEFSDSIRLYGAGTAPHFLCCQCRHDLAQSGFRHVGEPRRF